MDEEKNPDIISKALQRVWTDNNQLHLLDDLVRVRDELHERNTPAYIWGWSADGQGLVYDDDPLTQLKNEYCRIRYTHYWCIWSNDEGTYIICISQIRRKTFFVFNTKGKAWHGIETKTETETKTKTEIRMEGIGNFRPGIIHEKSIFFVYLRNILVSFCLWSRSFFGSYVHFFVSFPSQVEIKSSGGTLCIPSRNGHEWVGDKDGWWRPLNENSNIFLMKGSIPFSFFFSFPFLMA